MGIIWDDSNVKDHTEVIVMRLNNYKSIQQSLFLNFYCVSSRFKFTKF
jgi:hypothetical protein